MRQLLIHLVARSGQEHELEASLPPLVRAGCDAIGAGAWSGTAMIALEEDPFRMTGNGQPTRAFDASIEISAETEDAPAAFESLVEGLAERLEDRVHADLSTVQTGTRLPFIPCEPTPIRYQYCMRRRHDLSPEQYLRHYKEVHSHFGLEIRGVRGYTQVHLDPNGTRRACQQAGFGLWQWNSVSVLHLASVEEFIAQARFNSETGFDTDEEKFVDRPNSVMWCSREIFRIDHET